MAAVVPPAGAPMRVLVVTNDFPPRRGGIESFVRSVCDGLAGESAPPGVVVLTATMRGSGSVDRDLPYPVVRDQARMLLPTPRVGRHAEALLKEYDCDVVVFGAAAPLGWLAPRLVRAGATRTVALTHGHEVWWARVPGARSLLRRIATGVDVLTYVSEFCRAEINSALRAPDIGWARLSPGIDTELFNPSVDGREWRARWGVDQATPVVLAASRLVRRKGHDVLLEAWPAVVAARPDARLVIVGDGPRRSALARLVRQRGLQGSVRVVPGVSWNQMPAVYAAADIFVLPCRTRLHGLEPEALGIVFLEAAACGLPVVVGRSGGAPETVRDGESGFVVDPRDPTAVAERLVELIANPVRAAQFGRRGRAYVRERYGLTQMNATVSGLLWPQHRPAQGGRE
jgi:phosphatidylinositol alpha-1,6-mannosyltransferase